MITGAEFSEGLRCMKPFETLKLIQIIPRCQNRMYGEGGAMSNVSGCMLAISKIECVAKDPGPKENYEYFMYSFFSSIGNQIFDMAKLLLVRLNSVTKIVAVFIRFLKSF
jgi:hypothetical protein